MKHALIALALVASTAHAQYWTGADLNQKLADEESQHYLHAQGYIIGVVDAHDGTAFCVPGGVKGSQLFDMVKKTLREHPERRHDTSGAAFVIASMMRAFPCRDGGGT